MTMTQIDHRTIIALSSVKGVGPVKLRKMISQIQDNNVRIETCEDLYDFLMEYAPTSVKVSDDLAEDAFRRASRILSESKRLGIGVLTYFDPEYPENLRNTVSEDGKTTPPMILYYMGNLDALKRPAVAIIGTRHPTAKGVQAGEFISKAVAALGYNIVSGLAIGCDTLGHKGALDVRGTTTAFLAHGLDTIYPQENEGLAKRIVENGGLLLSEYPIGTTCNAYRLVERDRLQAGLADATLVIQTGIKGGTMHAVRATQKAGKGLYAISYGEPERSHVNVAGNAMLINQGATPVYQNSDMNTLFQPKKRIEKQLNLFSDD